jgi:hypothetical protein
MATNCEDIGAQMMELLYGELPAEARASVDAHVASCARCRSELEGFERTRALARRGLDEAPPARARAAIMQAAAAHLAAQAQPAARPTAVPDKVSLWDRLRARWAFPTLATVGAVAVFVVANRVFLNPERTMDRPTIVVSREEAPAAPPTPAAAPASSGLDREASAATPRLQEEAQAGARQRPAHRPARASRADDMKPADGDRLDRLYKDAAATGEAHAAKRKGGGAAGVFAEPPPPKAEASADKVRRDQPMDGRFAPPPPPREEGTTVKRKAPVAASSEKEADEARAPSTTARRARAPSQSFDDVLGGAEKPASSAGPGALAGAGGAPRGKADGFGAGAAQAAPPAAAPAPARNETAKRAISAPAPAPIAEAAPAMAPPPPAPAAKARAKKSADPAPEEGYAAEGDARKEEKQSNSTVRSNANDTLLQRADRLFADGRWTEAAAIYRELLRRDPRSDDAERWRRRLAAAETAELNERNANLAEKRNAENARSRKPTAPAKASKSSGKAAATDAAQ